MIFDNYELFACNCGLHFACFRWYVGTVVHGIMAWYMKNVVHHLKCNNVPSTFTCNEYRWYCGISVYLQKMHSK